MPGWPEPAQTRPGRRHPVTAAACSGSPTPPSRPRPGSGCSSRPARTCPAAWTCAPSPAGWPAAWSRCWPTSPTSTWSRASSTPRAGRCRTARSCSGSPASTSPTRRPCCAATSGWPTRPGSAAAVALSGGIARGEGERSPSPSRLFVPLRARGRVLGVVGLTRDVRRLDVPRRRRRPRRGDRRPGRPRPRQRPPVRRGAGDRGRAAALAAAERAAADHRRRHRAPLPARQPRPRRRRRLVRRHPALRRAGGLRHRRRHGPRPAGGGGDGPAAHRRPDARGARPDAGGRPAPPRRPRPGHRRGAARHLRVRRVRPGPALAVLRHRRAPAADPARPRRDDRAARRSRPARRWASAACPSSRPPSRWPTAPGCCSTPTGWSSRATRTSTRASTGWPRRWPTDPSGLDPLCDHLLVALGRDGDHDDDVALLVAELAGLDAGADRDLAPGRRGRAGLRRPRLGGRTRSSAGTWSRSPSSPSCS